MALPTIQRELGVLSSELNCIRYKSDIVTTSQVDTGSRKLQPQRKAPALVEW